MKKNITLTIAMAAYNEEANIAFLLNALLSQNLDNIKLDKILIISDGSNDDTVSEVNKIKNKKISLINRKKRLGVIKTQNEILKNTSSDILVMLDADVLPSTNNFIQEIIKPILKDKNVGLVGADTKGSIPSNFFERILNESHEMKKEIYSQINKGNNIYFCHGRARAFSKSFYSVIKWQGTHPEDAFSYLLCLEKGFKFVFQKKAVVQFRSPASLSDHKKQSLRFIDGKKRLEKYFSPNILKKEYHLPKSVILSVIILRLFKKPLTTLSFIMINLFINFIYKHETPSSIKWDMSGSTKKVII